LPTSSSPAHSKTVRRRSLRKFPWLG
jgi:hypothetical protein